MARGVGGKSPSNIAHSLEGVDFPANRDDLIQHAKQHDADEEVLDVMQHMPQRDYGSMADVMKGVGEVE